MVIHTVGDSHSYSGWSGVTTNHLGPMLCYTFGKKHKRFDIHSLNLKEGDSIIFCFGEIDCRCHVNKYVRNNVSYTKVIDTIVSNYFKAIQKHVSKLPFSLKHVCVFNVVPPVRASDTEENKDYPFLGSDEERRSYVEFFNNMLRLYCFVYQYVFIDVYDKYADEDGFLKKGLSDGNVHIKDGKHLNDFLRQLE